MIGAPRIRIILLALTLLVAIQFALAVFAYLRSEHDAEDGFRFPLPARIAAMVETVERTPPEDRPVLLDALESEDVTVWLSDDNALDMPGEQRAQLPSAEMAVSYYLDALRDRDVRAWLAPVEGEALRAPRFERLRLWSPHPMRLAVRLKTGDWLVVESSGNHAETILGTPSGFWSGFLGVLVAALAVVALWRGMAPLEPLARSVERFAARPSPEPVKPSGPQETRRIIEAVNRMQEDLSGFIAERQVMFGALSHDLRTYLTRLKLRIDLIQEDDARVRAEGDIDAMSEIIEDALLLSKLDGAPMADLVPIDIGLLVSELASGRDLPATQVRIDPSVDGVYAMGDPLTLLRALENLIENAEAYGKSAEIEVTLDNEVIRLDILDRGPGIRPRDRERLLKPFERGDAARSQAIAGTGLGLAIAQRAAARCGGKLELLDRPGGGLIARLEYPF